MDKICDVNILGTPCGRGDKFKVYLEKEIVWNDDLGDEDLFDEIDGKLKDEYKKVFAKIGKAVKEQKKAIPQENSLNEVITDGNAASAK